MFHIPSLYIARSHPARRKKQLVVFQYAIPPVRSPMRASDCSICRSGFYPARPRSCPRPSHRRRDQVVVHIAAFRHRLRNITPVARSLPLPYLTPIGPVTRPTSCCCSAAAPPPSPSLQRITMIPFDGPAALPRSVPPVCNTCSLSCSHI